MKRCLFLLILAAVFVLVGCRTITYYEPQFVTDNAILKTGEAPVGPGGIAAAAQNGGITQIATVDIRVVLKSNPFGAKYENVYVVSGE
jgi:hypothetical protein